MINLSLFFVSDLDIFNRLKMSSDPSLGLWIRTNSFFLQAEEKELLWPDPLLKCKGFHLSPYLTYFDLALILTIKFVKMNYKDPARRPSLPLTIAHVKAFSVSKSQL